MSAELQTDASLCDWTTLGWWQFPVPTKVFSRSLPARLHIAAYSSQEPPTWIRKDHLTTKSVFMHVRVVMWEIEDNTINFTTNFVNCSRENTGKTVEHAYRDVYVKRKGKIKMYKTIFSTINVKISLVLKEGFYMWRAGNMGIFSLQLYNIKLWFRWQTVLFSYPEHRGKLARIKRELFRGQILSHLYFYNLQWNTM